MRPQEMLASALARLGGVTEWLVTLRPASKAVLATLTVLAVGGGAIAYEAFSPPVDASRPTIAPRPAPQRAVASAPATSQPAAVEQHTGGQDCLVCHVSPHPERVPCTKCHEPGTTWKVAHPDDTNCASCHDTPKKHYAAACGTCHTPGKAFSTASYDHRGASSCQTCHTPPHGKRGTCTSCHRTGTWKPTSGAVDHRNVANCLSCHKAGHGDKGAKCSTCHRPGVSWTFKHPSSGKCTTCHKTSHASRGTCTSCHRAGVSWAFRHPSSKSCSSCHKAPGKHYGTSCASCHTPSKSWSSATFEHPSVPGGEHSYRSFACTNCHPSGYSSASCTKCHEGGAPNEDEEEDDD